MKYIPTTRTVPAFAVMVPRYGDVFVKIAGYDKVMARNVRRRRADGDNNIELAMHL